MPRTTAPSGRAQALRLLADCAVLAALLWGYHRVLLRWLAASGERLGAIDARQVAPLHASLEAEWHLAWWPPALLALGLFWWALPRLVRADGPRPRRLLVAATSLFLLIAPAVSMMDGYQVRAGVRAPALVSAYTRDSLEYRGDVPAVERAGVVGFLRKYSERRLFARLSLHTRTHPPGGVLFQWAVSRLFGPGLWPAALATIAFAALTVPLVYLIAREGHGPAVARVAVALFLVTPNFVMFTATSMDGPFAVFPALATWLFLRALRAARARPATAALAGVAAAAACFMTYAALFLGPLLLVLGLLAVRAGWTSARRLAASLAWGGAGALLVYVLLAGLGYDAPAALRASMAHDQEMMDTGRETAWRHLAIGVANLAAFLIGIGLALGALSLRATAASILRFRARQADPLALSAGLTVLAMAFSTLFTLEVERVWLFLVPLVAAAAARHLHALVEASGSLAVIRTAGALQCLQLFAFEALLRTGW
ncbi:MAG TPA: glycosyltransferase family 39 protein [Vicinamibacteria bacterium]|nr:glycosyltransferase family 39 protein [Vicinamibacteria bacterium]